MKNCDNHLPLRRFPLRQLTILIMGTTAFCQSYASDNATQAVQSLGARAPAGFAQFFSQNSGPVTIDLYQQRLTVKADFTAISATVNTGERAALIQFFTENGVKADIATAMADRLASGIESSPACHGLVSECVIYPEAYDFVFDEQNRRLRVFVNDQYLDLNARLRYFDRQETRALSMVNASNLYTQSSRENSSSRWANYTTVGLPIGYFQADTAWVTNDSDNGLDVYEANYIVDMKGFSAEIGFDTTLDIENNAFSLARGQVAGGYHATLFSNQRLAVRDQNRFDNLTLFVAQATQLEIMRGDRLIYQTMLHQGVNRISYSTFEQGSYNVELIFKVGGNVVKTETRNIFNIPLFQMSKGELEWFARGGRYQEDTYGDYNYAKGGFSKRFFDSAILGGGYENIDGLSLFSGYLESVPNQYVRAGLVVNSDFNRNVYYNAQLVLGPLTATGEWMDADNDRFRAIYQSNDFRQLSLSVPFNLFGGSYSFNALHYETEADPQRNQPGTEMRSLFLTGSHMMDIVTVSGTVQYDYDLDNNNTDDSGWLVALNISVPFDGFNLASGYQHDRYGNGQIQSTFGYRNNISDNTALGGEVTLLSNNDEQQFSAMASIDHQNRYASGNAYLYANSDGQVNSSINLSSTQLIDSETFLFTSTRSPAYMVMENASVTGINAGDDAGHMEIRNRSEGGTSVVAMNRTTQVLPVAEYSQFDMQLQTANAQYTSLDDGTHDYYSKPGTFAKVKNNLVKINRYLVSFTNEQGEFAPNVTCKGTGCSDIQEIADNVYQISLFDGYNFVLQSGKDICLLPNMLASGEVLNLGRSICTGEHTLERLANTMPKDHRLYYLGATGKVNPDLTAVQIKVGDLYGQFLFSREETVMKSAGVVYKVPVEYYSQRYDALESAGITPREIRFPLTYTDQTVAQE